MDTLVIHKYRLPFLETGLSVVDVPVRVGGLMHLAMQHGEVHVWAAVDPKSRETLTRFHLVGTGGAVDPSWRHLGTVMDGGFVWHVFSSTVTAITRQATYDPNVSN